MVSTTACRTDGMAGGFLEVQPELHGDWVNETVSWSEKRSKAPPLSVTSASTTSSAFLSSKSSSKSSNKPIAGSFNSPSTHSAFVDTPRSAFGASPKQSSRSKSPKQPSRPPPAAPEVTTIGLGAGLQAKKTKERLQRAKSDVEFSAQRKELDQLMDLVIQLQDQGRFKEVAPYMKRIEALQKKIESGWEQDHVAKTGVPPKKPPQQRRNIARATNRSGKLGENGLSVQLASFEEPLSSNTTNATPKTTQQQSMQAVPVSPPVPSPSPDHNVMSPTAFVQFEGTVQSTAPTKKAVHKSSSEGDDNDEDNDEGEEEEEEESRSNAPKPKRTLFAKLTGSSAASKRSATNAATFTSERKPRGRKWSLSKNTSDYLLLVGAEEESEIIKTLKNREKSRPMSGISHVSAVSASSASSSASTIFAKPNAAKRAKVAKSEKSAQSAKERVMLTMQGYMYKSPPENKRFSRWHNRYFTLAGPLLSYRKKPGASTSRLIDLKGATAEVVHLKYYSSKGRHEIRIKPKGSKRVYRLREKSKRKVIEWFVAILNNIKVADREGDVAKLEKRRREKQKGKQDQDQGWAPPVERSRVGEDITRVVGEEDIFTFYKTLGVSETASHTMIKKRYRELAREYHPDKNRGNTDITRFAEIARAFETLQSTESRAAYDLCERVKKLFRSGILFTLHETNKPPQSVVMFMDNEFKFLFWQDPSHGTVLSRGYKYVHIRFIQAILAGTDGFDCPPGRADCCLTLVGARLGCSLGIREEHSINLQLDTKQARDDILDGFRILRCRFSELFKQRLEKMKEDGMR